MATRINSSSESLTKLVNVFDGIKMALLRKGRVRRPPSLHKTTKAAPKKSQTTEMDPDGASGTGKIDQAAKDTVKGIPESASKETKKLALVTEKSHEILYKTDTVFPFTLFPDTITVEREKISIANRIFFRVAKIIHIPVRDLLHVEADVGPFFGSIHITSRFFSAKPFTVNYLWRKDALRLQILLQGYIIAYEREIECLSIEKDKLVELLSGLGTGETS